MTDLNRLIPLRASRANTRIPRELKLLLPTVLGTLEELAATGQVDTHEIIGMNSIYNMS